MELSLNITSSPHQKIKGFCLPKVSIIDHAILIEFIQNEWILKGQLAPKAYAIETALKTWIESPLSKEDGYLFNAISWGSCLNEPKFYGTMDTSVLRDLLLQIIKESWTLDTWAQSVLNLMEDKAVKLAPVALNDKINTKDLMLFASSFTLSDILRVKNNNPENNLVDKDNLTSLQDTFRKLKFTHSQVGNQSRDKLKTNAKSNHLYVLALEYTKDGYWDRRALQHLFQRFDEQFFVDLKAIGLCAKSSKKRPLQRLGKNLLLLINS